MKTPSFWDTVPPDWRARLLQPFGWVYGAITTRRMATPGEALPIPVLCVGNLTAGGAGKTPTVRWLAAQLMNSGIRPFILSRGHGGRLAGPVLVDPDSHVAADVGDEPLLLARQAPVIIARDRLAGARLALTRGARCLIMDDGLQNPALAKALTVAVIDGASGFGNGLCVPAGPLRAPPQAQWPHVHQVLVIGGGDRGQLAASQARAAGVAVSRARLVPETEMAALLRGKRVLAISGIGRPQKFTDTLTSLGAVVVAEQRYPDHVAYGRADADFLGLLARRTGLLPVTTEKDAVKLSSLWSERDHGPLAILPVRLDVEPDEALMAALAGFIATC